MRHVSRQLAPSAPLLDVALASNRVFALVPGFFARYETPVPASVTELDYLDFEAKLESRAHDIGRSCAQAVDELGATGTRCVRRWMTRARAARFDAHVKAITGARRQRRSRRRRSARRSTASTWSTSWKEVVRRR